MQHLTIPSLRAFRNDEFIQFITDTVNVCVQNDPVKLLIQAQVDALAACIGKMEQFFEPSKANKVTAVLQDIDQRRDRAITGIHLHTESYRLHYNDNLVLAGNLILASMDSYGKKIINKSYIAKTEVINKLVSDFKNKADLADAISLLNLGNWVNELSTANKLFNENYIKRTLTSSVIQDGNLREERNVTVETYKKLAARINALREINGSQEYGILIKGLDIITDKCNQLVAMRHSNGKAGTSNHTLNGGQ